MTDPATRSLTRPGPASPSRSPARFFLLVFALSVPFWLAGAHLDLELLPGLPVSALHVVCPALAAAILVHRERGAAGVIGLLRRSFDHARVPSRLWYLPALLLMPAVTLAAYALMRWMETPLPPVSLAVPQALALLPLAFAAALGEELGWSGYAIDPLQERWTALGAAILLGLVWSAWHVVALMQAGRSATWIAWWCLYTVAGRVILTWLYDNAGRSVLVAAMLHAMGNVCWQLFPERGSHWDPRLTGLLLAGVAAAITAVWGPRTLAQLGGATAAGAAGAGR